MSDNLDELHQAAKRGANNAYAPYSQFNVGACIQTHSGATYTGCNVENASFGLTLCAERNAISTAVANGAKPGDIETLVLFVDCEDFISPCGACRQVMAEFMPATAKVTTFNNLGQSKSWSMQALLPDGFTL